MTAGSTDRRQAIVTAPVGNVEPYLYGNWRVKAQIVWADGTESTLLDGVDVAGFTLESQLDRLASGLYWGKEIAPLT